MISSKKQLKIKKRTRARLLKPFISRKVLIERRHTMDTFN